MFWRYENRDIEKSTSLVTNTLEQAVSVTETSNNPELQSYNNSVTPFLLVPAVLLMGFAIYGTSRFVNKKIREYFVDS